MSKFFTIFRISLCTCCWTAARPSAASCVSSWPRVAAVGVSVAAASASVAAVDCVHQRENMTGVREEGREGWVG